jgi:predicted amidohydrolase
VPAAPIPTASADAWRAAAPGALRVALGEYDTGWHDPEGSLERAADAIARAAGQGARLVLLPEMCTTGFTMDAERWAEPLDGPSATRLAELAARHRVWLIAGLAAREGDGAPFNAAAVFDDAGALRAAYRKQRLFAHGGEHASYAPGESPVIVEIDGVRVSPFVCYDLRFPELFRAVAREVDAIALIANWPVARRAHWDARVRARAIENLCYVAAVNRVGEAGGIAYDGGSIVYGPWGDVLASTGSGETTAVTSIDPAVVRATRERYRFLDDMRV